MPDAPPYQGDYQTIARFLNPVDAQTVCGCMQAAGIQAYVADANTVQTNALWSIAMGGASLRVPAQRMDEAREIMAAFDRGDFALPDEEPSP